MGADIAKFIPSDMRTRIVQDLITEMGIRPLSNAIGVNSKTVYKYKLGSSCPTDETMMRILAVVKEKYPSLLKKYIDELQDNFSVALDILPKLEIQPVEKPSEAPPEVKKMQQPEVQKHEVPVERASEVTKFTIYENLGVSKPSDRMVLAKILAIMQGIQESALADVAQKSNISLDIVKKYVEMLIKAGYAEKTSSDTYRLTVKVHM
jgi:predicted transcriptional regulator